MLQEPVLGTPPKRIHFPSPIIISSTILHLPSLILDGSSKVDAISAPVTRANLSIPSKSACSIVKIP